MARKAMTKSTCPVIPCGTRKCRECPEFGASKQGVCKERHVEELHKNKSMSSSTAPPLHEALTPLAWLVGTWQGEEGTGDYPTIKDFKYKEEVKFEHVGQPNLEFSFNSSHYETNKPLHREKGFLKIQPGTSHLAMVNTQNVGIVELSEGEVKGQEITLESHTIGRMTFGKDPAVTKIQRTFRLVDPDTLEQVVSMETSATTPSQHHLSIQYKKVA